LLRVLSFYGRRFAARGKRPVPKGKIPKARQERIALKGIGDETLRHVSLTPLPPFCVLVEYKELKVLYFGTGLQRRLEDGNSKICGLRSDDNAGLYSTLNGKATPGRAVRLREPGEGVLNDGSLARAEGGLKEEDGGDAAGHLLDVADFVLGEGTVKECPCNGSSR
jgi:hypothetical protein